MKSLIFILFLFSCGNDSINEVEPGPQKEQSEDPIDTYDPGNYADIVKSPPGGLPQGYLDFGIPCDEANGVAELSFYEGKILSLGGYPVSAYSSIYKQNYEGYNKFLDDSGIRNFSAEEISKSNHADVLKKCGIRNLMPPRACWTRSAVLLLMAEKIRAHLGHPISVEALYRSKCYNKEFYNKIRGTKDSKEVNSDHVLARAIDLSYKTNSKFDKMKVRKKVQRYICEQFWFDIDYNSLTNFLAYQPNLSAGFGTTRIHFGFDSPKGRRAWSYDGDSILKEGVAKECFWDDVK